MKPQGKRRKKKNGKFRLGMQKVLLAGDKPAVHLSTSPSSRSCCASRSLPTGKIEVGRSQEKDKDRQREAWVAEEEAKEGVFQAEPAPLEPVCRFY